MLKQPLQILLQNLPVRIPRQRLFHEPYRHRHLEDRQTRLHPRLQFGLGRFHAGGWMDIETGPVLGPTPSQSTQVSVHCAIGRA